jgi:hypothetical protein
MKLIVADIYTFYIHNSKNVSFPKRYKNYKIIWNLREALLALWEGNIKELALPRLGTPGYDFEGFIDDLQKIGQIKNKPLIKYYELEVAKKS